MSNVISAFGRSESVKTDPPKQKRLSVAIWCKTPFAFYYANEHSGVMPAMPLFQTKEKQ
jgi:hypothetical protein